MLSTFSEEVLDAMANKKILLHLHHHGIPFEDYTQYSTLSDFFKVLSTNIILGTEIVTTAEAKNYPIYSA